MVNITMPSLASRLSPLLALPLLAVLLSGCAQDAKPKPGAKPPANSPSATAPKSATEHGSILGAFAAGGLAKSLEPGDLRLAEKTAQHAFETAKSGQNVTWKNPDNGHGGTITPTRTYETPQGGYCREYAQTVTVAEQQETAYGTACRQGDGTWKMVK